MSGRIEIERREERGEGREREEKVDAITATYKLFPIVRKSPPSRRSGRFLPEKFGIVITHRKAREVER
jgi:hypothetical protein